MFSMEPVLGAWTLVDLAVIAGVALVLPAGLGDRRRWWVAAAAVAGATAVEPGSSSAVVLALVWPATGLVVLTTALRRAGPFLFWSRADGVRLVASAYALVAATWFVLSCAGATPLGIHEPIVELTAVHFTYVGVGALTLAEAARGRARSRGGRRLGRVALALTGGAPLVVATGFTSGSAVLQIGGAVLLCVGVFATAALELRAATRPGSASTRVALAVSGLAIWAPMVLAVAWATAQHVSTPALSTADMVPAHGAVNAIAFVGAGLVARALEANHRREQSEQPEGNGPTATGSETEEVARGDRRNPARAALDR